MVPTSLFGVKYNEVYLGVWSIIQWGLLGCLSKNQWGLLGCLEYNTMGPTWCLNYNKKGPTWVFGVKFNGAYLVVWSKVQWDLLECL